MGILRIVKNAFMTFLLVVTFVSCATTDGTKSGQGRVFEHDFERESFERATSMGL